MTRHLDKLRLRLRSLFRSRAAERDLARELQAHLDEEAAANREAGMTPEDARRRALASFGSMTAVADACRDTRRVNRVEAVVRDVRSGVRALVHQPGLFAVAAASIALGVGANLTVFSVGNSFLLAAPTAAAPDRLVQIRTGNGSHVPYAGWRALAESGVLDGVAGYQFEQSVNVRDGEASSTVVPMLVTANFFDVLQARMALGRGFTASEAGADLDPHLVVVSDRFWRLRLGADPSRVGSSVTINGEPYTVVGVLPERFRSISGFGLAPEVYLPLSERLFPALHRPGTGAAQLFGRLGPDQSIDAARAAVAAAVARIGQEQGDREFAMLRRFDRADGLTRVSEFREAGIFMLAMFVLSGLVLAIACANVAGLLLARGHARRGEIALRLALGASRGRLLQQLLVESLLLMIAGSAAGAAIAGLGFLALARVPLPLPIPVELHAALDWRTTALAVAVVGLGTMLTGLVPALQSTRTTLMPALKHEERTLLARRFRLRRLLVTGQVAVSIVLLVAALLFARSLMRARAVDVGFDADRVLVVQLSFVEGRQGPAGQPAVEGLVERIRALPGVSAAAYAEGVPLTLFSGSHHGTSLRIEGRDTDVHAEFASDLIGPGYLATMGIKLHAGRDFTRGDRTGRAPVVMVNEAFAARYLAGIPAVGARVGLGRNPPAEIVGVVGNGKYRSLSEVDEPAVFEPLLSDETPNRLVHLLVRSAGDPGSVAADVRRTLVDADPALAVTTTPLETAIGFAVVPSRLGSWILGALGGLGTVLAMVGLAGVISFDVGRRTRELAIRMSLGASRTGVVGLVLRDAGALVGAGLIGGAAVALLITGPLASFLVAGISPTDPVSFGGAAALMGIATLAALISPVRRALRVSPAQTLKVE
jgi:predicted permease